MLNIQALVCLCTLSQEKHYTELTKKMKVTDSNVIQDMANFVPLSRLIMGKCDHCTVEIFVGLDYMSISDLRLALDAILQDDSRRLGKILLRFNVLL